MKVFISYSRIDASETANTIHTYLTQIGHHEVFIDTSNIHGGDEWWKIIQENISNCDIFVIIVTPSALYRSEVEKEVELAKNLKKKIIPCIAKSYVEEEEIKWELNKYQGYFYESDSKLAMHLHKMIKQGANIQRQMSVEAKTIRELEDYSPTLEEQNLRETEFSDSKKQRQNNNWSNQAYIFLKKKNYQKAIVYYDKALEIDPNNINALNNKGIALYNQGKYQNAIKWFDKALEIDSEYVDALNNKGMAFDNLRKYKDAIEYYDKALEIDPNNTTIKNNKKSAIRSLSEINSFYNKTQYISKK